MRYSAPGILIFLIIDNICPPIFLQQLEICPVQRIHRQRNPRFSHPVNFQLKFRKQGLGDDRPVDIGNIPGD